MLKNYRQDQIEKTHALLRVIGDVNNLLILYELINFGEKSFNELKRMTSINAVTLTKKLNSLKIDGYIHSHHRGKENHYYPTTQARQLVPLIKEIEKAIVKP